MTRQRGGFIIVPPPTVACPQCSTTLNRQNGFLSCPKCEHCEYENDKRRPAMSFSDKQQQVEQVRQRLDKPRADARLYVQWEAERAGLDADTVSACVDAAMSAYDDLIADVEAWEDMVASVIQGHAAP